MPSVVVSEHWTASQRELSAADLLRSLGPAPCCVLYGDGPTAFWLVRGEEPLVVLTEPRLGGLSFERHGEPPEIRPDLMGFLSYELGYGLDRALPTAPSLDGFPACYLVVFRRVEAYHRPSGVLYSAVRRLEHGEAAPRERHSLGNGPFTATRISGTETAASYAEKVTRIREEIRLGNVYQVNLSRQETWRVTGSLVELASKLWRCNPASYSALVAGPGFTVISTSPERFLRVSEGRITSCPIKGTVPRGRTEVADAALLEALRSSEKNLAELAMITDLVRNDLTRVSEVPGVAVEAFPDLMTLANVHHMVSTVSGRLRPGVGLEELLAATFPGGSVTGCPKIAAMALIRELEPRPRAAYTGALGWLAHDLSALDLGLAIRTAWARGAELHFGVGGGVTYDSDPCDEYNETVHKARSLKECLSH